MGNIKQKGDCLRDEQQKYSLRAKSGDFERPCHRLKQESKMMIKPTSKTQIKLALIFDIKTQQGEDFVEVITFTQLV
ncbi:hypothetical protein PVK06_045396 [Gossypium arboreum]|uniref:Uncharacterized protein n=1 Tax=Gossypium arboreum TaxID=29729 RepID=A0ABR0MTY5_GOSAR|nr:hypothetical protein PVK06_045396 [Gossypium arboreum]